MPAKHMATYGILGKSWQILAAVFGILLTVSALYASDASRRPGLAILALALAIEPRHCRVTPPLAKAVAVLLQLRVSCAAMGLLRAGCVTPPLRQRSMFDGVRR